jgi:hypothetical protein
MLKRVCHRGAWFHESKFISPSLLQRCVLVSVRSRSKGRWTDRGLMQCHAKPITARRTKSAAEAMYAHPRKGFFPPIQETVEMTTDLVPPNCSTGKSTATQLAKSNTWNNGTDSDEHRECKFPPSDHHCRSGRTTSRMSAVQQCASNSGSVHPGLGRGSCLLYSHWGSAMPNLVAGQFRRGYTRSWRCTFSSPLAMRYLSLKRYRLRCLRY